MQTQKQNAARLGIATTLLCSLMVTFVPQAEASVIFTTEEGVINTSTLQLGEDTVDTDITIEFGEALGASLVFDSVADNFEFDKDVDFQDNEIENIIIHSGTAFPTAVEGKLFYRTDLNLLHVNIDGTVPGWQAIATGANADTLDGLDSTQFLRSDTSDNFTAGTLTFDNGTTLELAAGSTLDADDATVNLDEITNNSLTLDSDDTGGNVDLIFGTAAAARLRHTGAQFEFNDDVDITGTITASGDATFNGGVNLGDANGDVININGQLGTDLDFNQQLAVELVLDQGGAFPVVPAPIEGQKFWRTDLDQEFVFDGTNWIPTTNPNGLDRTLEFAAEYEDATLFGDGVDNKGTMSADHDATNDRNFYRWETRQTTIQDYDIVLQVRVPDDFADWDATAPITIQHLTDTGATVTEAQVDVTVSDTTGAAEGALAGNLNLNTGGAWTNATITGLAGTYTPGDFFLINIKLHSRRNAGTDFGAQVGEIILNYDAG